jgi:integrase
VRSFPISPALAKHLAVFIGERKGLLFTTRTGKPLDNYNVVKWVLKPLLKEIGIEDTKHMGIHSFRHCNASALDSLGAPMRIRMDRLGHAQQETTWAIRIQILGTGGLRPSWVESCVRD